MCPKSAESCTSLVDLRLAILKSAHELFDFMLKTKSHEALKSLHSNLESAKTIAKGLEKIEKENHQDFEVKEKFAPNKHFETQRKSIKFYSTKRKSVRKRLK